MRYNNLLGYAGLIPFILLPLLYVTPLLLSQEQVLELYGLYSALILGFMAGVLWPVLHNQTPAPEKAWHLPLAAVMLPILSFIALLCAKPYFLPLQACLYVLLRLSEYRLGINRQYSKDYRALRNQLTTVVLLSHLSLRWLVSMDTG
ncbi:MAG TPA: DUF3429 domain-containing protein [Rheinheimera sp.]|uniref:DUF3429 domain-containing protein n=1 Tax=Rheinheimera sp. TaxID=1869214 RepID=UPI002F933E49